MRSIGSVLVALVLFGTGRGPESAEAQVQVRFGDSTRANYSELHEALIEGTPAADTVLAILGTRTPRPLWVRFRQALAGSRSWNDGLLALTRIAELRDRASADSAGRLRRSIESGKLTTPAGSDATDLLPFMHAIVLERSRTIRKDQALLADLLPRVPGGQYDIADAWVFGRLRDGAADSVIARFLATDDQALRIRYLTLLSFTLDSSAVPFLARVYAAPDSFNIPPRAAIRASDGLLWVGTRGSLEALRDARSKARARGIYADPKLAHADLDFLASDSSAVISRTGHWLDDWIARLPAR
ncbi:MAG: hypothetical protein ABJD11_14665 [Gemmatimonadota bacterium]